MTIRTKAHLSVLGANIIFGVNYSMVKFLTSNYIHPWAMNLVRISVSSVLLWLLFFFQKEKSGISKKDVGRFILCAVTGVAINQLLFTKGLSLTTSIHASLLALGTPVFITAIAAWLLSETFTWNKALGLVLATSGAVLLIFTKVTHTPANAKDMLLGDIMVLVNAISYAFYFVWVKPLMNKYSSVHVLRWTFTIGTFFILPFGLRPALDTNWHAFTAQAWMALAMVVVGATFFSYMLNMYSLKILGPGITGTYIYTQPIFASVIGIIFLQEPFGLVQVISALMIGIGVYVVNMRRKPRVVAAE
ncbi:MAG: DMT family transporter [Chitinophagaceae bacterium]